MQWRSLHKFLFLIFLSIGYRSSAQTETHDFITYDTTINYTCFPTMGGCSGNKFTIRISRPRNYFTPGNADTASRPWILTMPGRGEVGTDTNYLTLYGPHYWMLHGWDGGVQLRNGRHYPILVTIMASTADVRPWFMQAVMDTLIRRYHPRANSLHMAGLSMGVEVLGWYLGYQATAGDEHNMANVRSFTDLEGQAPGDYFGASALTYPYFFGYWAKHYGGRFFGLEGTNDTRKVYEISEKMNDSVAASGYYSLQTYGGGTHCCWDSMYDPSVLNWRCLAPVTNTHIAPSYYLHPNTLGNYVFDTVTGTNLFQWMLRQGDTTLIGSGTPPGNQLPVANAGPDKHITLPTDSVILTGSGSDADGTIVSYFWVKVSGTGGTIVSPSLATTTIRGLSAGVYKYSLTVTDNNGGVGKDTMQITVDTAAGGGGTSKAVNVQVYGGTNPYLNTAWNNWNNNVYYRLQNLKYADGTSSVYSVQRNYYFTTDTMTVSIADNGASYGGTMAPPGVLRYAGYNTVASKLTLSGLDTSLYYDLSIYASRANTGNNTNFWIGSDTVNIVTDNNLTNTANFTHLRPGATGTIVVGFSRGTGATYSYLNGFTLTESGHVTGAGAGGVAGAGQTIQGLALEDGVAKGLSLYPNPAAGEVRLVIDNAIRGKVEVGIYDATGARVRALRFTKDGSVYNTVLPVAGLRTGVYFVRVTMKGYAGTLKLVRVSG